MRKEKIVDRAPLYICVESERIIHYSWMYTHTSAERESEQQQQQQQQQQRRSREHFGLGEGVDGGANTTRTM